jgi:hypothetical protein
MAEQFSKPVLDILQKGGWYEGREVSLPLSSPPEFALFPKASQVLHEFGGLHFGECGPGVDCATSDVQIEPRLAAHLLPELRQFAQSRGMNCFPLGEVHRGHGFLIIDENGKTYLLSDELMPYANSFSDSLEMLLLGKQQPPGKC